MLFDTHVHLNDDKYNEDVNDVITRARDGGVGKMLIASYDEVSTRKSLELALTDDSLYCSVGIHPHQASAFNEDTYIWLDGLVKTSPGKIVAIGEIGLDYHYDFSPRDKQKEVFCRQIELASANKLPIIVHDRKAHDDCLHIVRGYKKRGILSDNPGVFHCFSGDYNLARNLLDIGFYISFAGPITFKNSTNSAHLIKQLPLDRILIETDCPYLSPEPFRGKRNEPLYVGYVASKISEILDMPVEEIQKITFDNACRLFSITQ
jgi:TatD DNase family protein